MWDGYISSYKHCARCWRLFEFLNDHSDELVSIGLDCGEVFEGKEDDPAQWMAFMSTEESQAYAKRSQQKEDSVIDELASKESYYRKYGNPISRRARRYA